MQRKGNPDSLSGLHFKQQITKKKKNTFLTLWRHCIVCFPCTDLKLLRGFAVSPALGGSKEDINEMRTKTI